MHTLNVLAYTNPNDKVTWTLMVVLYAFISGLAVGSYLVFALYEVFGVKRLKPVARFSLITSFAFLCFATAPHLLHLGRPESAMSIMFTPNPRSAMAGFGFIFASFFVLVAVQLWLCFRHTLVDRASRPGFSRFFYRMACLGVYSIPNKARQADAKVLKVLTAVGVPLAVLLHGYVEFMFGAVKANPWWSSSMMPVAFLLASAVSGLALVLVLYWIACKLRHVPINKNCFLTLVKYLWGFLIVAASLQGLEFLRLVYEATAEWEIMAEMIRHRIGYSFFAVYLLAGSILPMIALGWVLLTKRQGRIVEFVAYMSAALLLLAGLAMRWNVVIGGQLFSKSFRGLSDYTPPFLGREGILAGAILMVIPLVMIVVMCRVLPVWEESRRRLATP